MFKKILIVLMIGCFLLGMATRAEAENAKKEGEKENAKDTITDTLTQTQTQNKDENGYRIEVGKVKLRGEEKEEIRFISPEGNVVKAIPYETWEQQISFKISPGSNYVLNVDTESSNKLNLNYLDRTGKEMWTREFTIEGVGEEDFPSHGIELSKDGSSIVIFRNHELGYDSVQCNITVLDTSGKEKVSYSFDSMIETGALQISPDGKILGADTYKKGLGKCLFFLDVESGRTKFVKSEGKINDNKWKARFILSKFTDPKLPPSGKVWLSVAINPKNRWIGYLTFDEIPSDLSTLFGEQKCTQI